jgi:23S rRNA pseudouridine1911/1915/1917 synthase
VGGFRLDRFLADRVDGYSRNFLKDLVDRGCVSVDGTQRSPDYRLHVGEIVRVDWPETGWNGTSLEDRVIHEDADLLVLDKPAGLIMHPMGGSWEVSPEAALTEPEPNLAGLLLGWRPQAARSGVERCGLVHRLDRWTSGVLLVAKRPAAQHFLLAGFRERTIHKTYRALVLGALKPTRVSAPVGRISGMRRVQATQWGREAETAFKSLGLRKGVSLVSAEPKTGRTHQIRAHLAMIGHPVMGDMEWIQSAERARIQELGLPTPPRMMLHAWRLNLIHPRTRKPVVFTAPPPRDFKTYWDSLK